MKITLLGCGALGQVWLSALHQQGHEVQGWLRERQPCCHVDVRKKEGAVFSHTLTANDADFLASSDLLLVTLKAWQVASAVNRLATTLPPSSPILLIHNGMNPVDELHNVPQPLLLGVTTHAARHDDDAIVHVASGITHIGPAKHPYRNGHNLTAILHQALPEVIWHENIYPAAWSKLAVNCVINPLTALKGCRNGDLRHYPGEVAAICQEVAAVMACEGIPVSAENLLADINKIIASTAENISSMLQDIRMQRRTEIDYISGFLLKRAQAHGLAVPVNSHLYAQVKYKEKTYERIRTPLSRTRQ